MDRSASHCDKQSFNLKRTHTALELFIDDLFAPSAMYHLLLLDKTDDEQYRARQVGVEYANSEAGRRSTLRPLLLLLQTKLN